VRSPGYEESTSVAEQRLTSTKVTDIAAVDEERHFTLT